MGGGDLVMHTCLSCIFHGCLVGGLSIELLQHQLLELLRNRSLLICNVHR